MTDKDIRQIIAENIEAAMSAHSSIRSQTALAKVSKVAQSTIGRILRAEVSAGADNLQAIAKALDTTQARLVTPKEETLKTALASSSKSFFDLMRDNCQSLSIEEQTELAELLGNSIRNFAKDHWKRDQESKSSQKAPDNYVIPKKSSTELLDEIHVAEGHLEEMSELVEKYIKYQRQAREENDDELETLWRSRRLSLQANVRAQEEHIELLRHQLENGLQVDDDKRLA